MKLIYLLFFSSILFSEEITITERLFCPTTTFDVYRGECQVGTVIKQILSTGAFYDIKDLDSTLLATATARFLSWGTITDIEEPTVGKLGTIEETWTNYRIFNSENELVLIADKDCFGNSFSIYMPMDPSHIVATISRPSIHVFRDSWTIEIVDKSSITDPKLLILLAVYQTDKDNHLRFWSNMCKCL